MQVVTSTYQGMDIVTRYPNGYQMGKKYPVILFLHGAGTRGPEIEVLINNLFFQITETYEDFPFIVVAPHCVGENTWFELMPKVQSLALSLAKAEYTDPDRLYLVGNSMGGYGSWQLGMAMPDLFAAVIPLCGGGMYWNAARLKNVPVWAFHGGKDDVVLHCESQHMVDAINKNGGNARLTTYPEHGHDVWTDTYKNYEVFEWLLSHTKSSAAAQGSGLEGSDIYG